jgi:ATP adenylyltransferase
LNEVLFTPWRLAYLTSGAGLPESGGCLFCSLPGMDDAEALVVHRGALCYVVLNRFPYSNGHLMVTPFAHRSGLAGLTPEERREMFDLGAAAETILAEAYAPHGMNMGLNLGKSAGAGVVGHVHLHVVPRWDGDTNFMSVTAGTRTVPEDLVRTRERLAPLFAARAERSAPAPR